MKAIKLPKLAAALSEDERKHLWEIKMGRKFQSEYVPELYTCRADWERGFDANMHADGIPAYRDEMR